MLKKIIKIKFVCSILNTTTYLYLKIKQGQITLISAVSAKWNVRTCDDRVHNARLRSRARWTLMHAPRGSYIQPHRRFPQLPRCHPLLFPASPLPPVATRYFPARPSRTHELRHSVFYLFIFFTWQALVTRRIVRVALDAIHARE